MTLLTLLENYAASKLKFGERSEAEYRTTINKFGEWLERPATVSDLNKKSVRGYLKHRIQSRSEATAKKDRQQLLAMWRWAWDEELVDTLPRGIPKIEVPTKRVRAWKPSEVAAILQAAESWPVEKDWGPREWSALLLTIYDSAERISALLRCPLDGFDARERSLWIPASARKGRAADQLASLHETTVEAIETMIAGRRGTSDRLFSYWGCYRTLLRRFERLLDSAGVDRAQRKLFHDLRRTSFTLTWAALGKDAARDQCGHTADLSRFYLDHSLLADLRPGQRVADAIVRPV